MLKVSFILVMVLNALWFGSAYRLFWLKARGAAKIIVPEAHRGSPAYQTVIASIRFLGGMNLGLSFLSVLLIVFVNHFIAPVQVAVLCTAFAAAHLTQFLGNLPIWLAERRGEEVVWTVRSGPMLFIFRVDLAIALLNLGLAVGAVVGAGAGSSP
jgi:hypothetical protein